MSEKYQQSRVDEIVPRPFLEATQEKVGRFRNRDEMWKTRRTYWSNYLDQGLVTRSAFEASKRKKKKKKTDNFPEIQRIKSKHEEESVFQSSFVEPTSQQEIEVAPTVISLGEREATEDFKQRLQMRIQFIQDHMQKFAVLFSREEYVSLVESFGELKSGIRDGAMTVDECKSLEQKLIEFHQHFTEQVDVLSKKALEEANRKSIRSLTLQEAMPSRNIFDKLRKKFIPSMSKENALPEITRLLIAAQTGAGAFLLMQAFHVEPVLAMSIGAAAEFIYASGGIAALAGKEIAYRIEKYPHAGQVLSKLASEKTLSKAANQFGDFWWNGISGIAHGVALGSIGYIGGMAANDILHNMISFVRSVAHRSDGGGGDAVLKDPKVTFSGEHHDYGDPITPGGSSVEGNITPPEFGNPITLPVESLKVPGMVSEYEAQFMRGIGISDHFDPVLNFLIKIDRNVTGHWVDFSQFSPGSNIDLLDRNYAETAAHELVRLLSFPEGAHLTPVQQLMIDVAQQRVDIAQYPNGRYPTPEEIQEIIKYLNEIKR